MDKLPDLNILLNNLPNYTSKELVETLYYLLYATTAELEQERGYLNTNSQAIRTQNQIVIDYNNQVLDRIDELFNEEYEF